MPKLIVLGTSNAVPDEQHDNTHLLLIGENNRVLVDCASNPVMRLRRIGIEPNSISDVIMTHFHPDHVSGVPLLLMDMWLLGRKEMIKLYGLEHTVRNMETLLEAFEWERWLEYPVEIRLLQNAKMSTVLESEDFKIFSYPVEHFVPTIGLRFEFTNSGKVLAYTSDTAPTANVAWLAHGADVLLHEAAGASAGPSTTWTPSKNSSTTASWNSPTSSPNHHANRWAERPEPANTIGRRCPADGVFPSVHVCLIPITLAAAGMEEG